MLLMIFLVGLILSWMSVNFCEMVYLLLFLELAFYVIALSRMWHHIIMLVILLEFFSIKGFMFMVLFSSISLHSSMLFFYLVLMVCEAGLGLSLVSSLVRSGGGVFIY